MLAAQLDGANHPAPAQPQPLLPQWSGPAIIAVVLVIAAALSWRKWPDPLIDFGIQLYLPWKISTGSVLYHDVSYLTGGPLSQCFNGTLFKFFGVSLTTLIISNLLLTCVLLVVIYRRFLAAADAGTATIICLGLVLGFAFAQYGDIGNYNFITPYCHEIFHGLLLSIFGVCFLSELVTTGRVQFSVGTGFCAGLVFLTKPEIFAALAVANLAGFILLFIQSKQPLLVLKSLIALLVAGLLPGVGFLLYFHQVEDWHSSLRSVLFAWTPLLQSSISSGFYYRWCMGLDTPWYHLRTMFVHFGVLVGVLAIYAFALKRRISGSRLGPLVLIAPLLALASCFDWTDCGRSLPLLTLVLCVILVLQFREKSAGTPPVFPLLWGVFALSLLAKLGLFCRIWHYGFALAMPAFVAALYLLLWVIPLLLARYGVPRALFRTGLGLTLLLGFTLLFSQSELRYRQKTVPLGRGGDRILAFEPKTSPTGAAMQTALDWLSTNAAPNATLAVLPEGIMLNYLSRRTNPTRYCVWNPAEEDAFGQENMTAAFTNGSPDFVMLIERDAAEYGVKPFGQEPRFGLELMRWLERNYEPIGLIGQEPLQRDGQFGIKILKKLPRAG